MSKNKNTIKYNQYQLLVVFVSKKKIKHLTKSNVVVLLTHHRESSYENITKINTKIKIAGYRNKGEIAVCSITKLIIRKINCYVLTISATP